MIFLSKENLRLVRDILAAYVPNRPVYVFGSRVQGNHKPYSDLDLAIISKMPLDLSVLAELSDAFIQSDLPFKVDIIDWASIDKEFQDIILQNYEVIQ